MKLLVLFVIAATATLSNALTARQYRNAKVELTNLIRQDPRRIAGFVRLAFHDCVGPDGCDGCINHANPSNAGLSVYTEPLDTLYNLNYREPRILSRADFYQVAAVAALEEGTVNTVDKFNSAAFRAGRIDCTTSPAESNTAEAFPSATWQYAEVTNYYNTHFGLNARATTALLGAHTLGRANQGNSGFEGPWVRGGENTLNNAYYTELIDRPWISVTDAAQTLNPQWQLPAQPIRNTPGNINSNMFFDSDVCLAVQFTVNAVGVANCEMCPPNRPPRGGRTCCSPSAGFNDANDFRRDNGQWLGEFAAAFFQMGSKVNGNVVLQAPTRNGGRARGRQGDSTGAFSKLMKQIQNVQDEIESIRKSVA